MPGRQLDYSPEGYFPPYISYGADLETMLDEIEKKFATNPRLRRFVSVRMQERARRLEDPTEILTHPLDLTSPVVSAARDALVDARSQGVSVEEQALRVLRIGFACTPPPPNSKRLE